MIKLEHGGDCYTAREKSRGMELLDFSANLNPFGMPESVKRAAAKALEQCVRYPDPLCRKLRRTAAAYHGIAEDHVIFGNGAADLIFRLAVGIKPRRALVTAPTFAEYEYALDTVGCRTEHFFLREEDGFRLGSEFLDRLDSEPDLVFLCNPNNPTGRLIDRDVLHQILQRCREQKIRLVVDECFVDFLQEPERETLLPWISDHPQLFILRAFTKNFAMAGLRLGYGICSDRDLMCALYRAGQPWNVSLPAQEAGIAAFGEQQFLAESRAWIQSEKDWLAQQLAALGYRVFPPAANYILFRIEHSRVTGKQKIEEEMGSRGRCIESPDRISKSAEGEIDLHGTALFQEKLLQRGILIRDCSNYKGLSAGYFRVAVRSREENEKLLYALAQVEESGW